MQSYKQQYLFLWSPFLCKAIMTARVSLQVKMVNRGRIMNSSTILWYSDSISTTDWPLALSSSTSSTDMMSADLKCSRIFFWGGVLSSFSWQRGPLQLIAIHLIPLQNIPEYMQIAIIKSETADFVKINIYVILKTSGHNCSLSWTDK